MIVWLPIPCDTAENYEGDEYEEYNGEDDAPLSPSKSAAKLMSLRMELQGGKVLRKGQFASVKEALVTLTRSQKPKKQMDLKRVMNIAEPRSVKVERTFGKDEEEMKCYFQVHTYITVAIT